MTIAAAALAGILREAVADLRAARDPLDDIFLALGERLMWVDRSVGRLGRTLEDLSCAMDSQDIGRAVARLGRLGGEVGQLARLSTDRQAGVAGLGRQVTAVAGCMGHLRQSLGEVNALAINSRIQAAQIAGDGGDFTLFTGEIGRLAGLARGGLDRLAASLGALGRMIDAADASQQGAGHADDAALRDIAGRIEHGLAGLAEHRRRSAAALLALHGNSRVVSGRLGQAVRSLQVNDITRQRLEHVENALLAVAELLDPGAAAPPAWGEALAAQDKVLLAGAACRLQAMQARRAAEHFAQQVEALIAALAALARDADDLCHAGIAAHGAEHQRDGAFLLDLRRELALVATLLGGYAATADDLKRVVAAVTASVEEMTGHIDALHDIEVDIRIMGLNANLKCGRLGGKGRALAMIAQELRGQALRIEDGAGTIGAALRHMVAGARALAGGHDGAGEPEAADLINDLDGLLPPLEHSGRVFATALAGLRRDGEEIGRTLAAATTGITIHHQLGTALEAVASRVDGLAALAGDADVARLRDQLTSLLGDAYTMNAERDIHLMFAEAGETPQKAVAGDADAGMDAILF